jgi:DNA-binding transcriptional MerR regulator
MIKTEREEASEPDPVEAYGGDQGQDAAEKTIPNKVFFRIGEVASLLQVRPSVLRFWETEFSSVQPTKSASGHRVYRRKEVEKLFLIKKLLYVERFSIEGAKKKLKEMKLSSSKAMPEVSIKAVEKSDLSLRERLLQEMANRPVNELFKY